MTNETRAWLDTIEPTDTSATLERIVQIKEQAKREVEEETRNKLNQ
jgi:hypothetical protein